MSELMKKLDQHKLGNEIAREVVIENTVPRVLEEVVSEENKNEMKKIQSIFVALGFETKPIHFGFKITVDKYEYTLGINARMFGTSYPKEQKAERLCMEIHLGFQNDFLSSNMEEYLPPIVYEKNVEEKQQEIERYVTENKDAINEKLNRYIQKVYSDISKLILSEKRMFTIEQYHQIKDMFDDTKNTPIMALKMDIFDMKVLKKLLEETKDESKFKLLISMVPILQHRWLELNQLFSRFSKKQEMEDLNDFVNQNYPIEVVETIIKGKKKEKAMLRAYGLMWKNKIESDELYQYLEEFLLKVQETEEKLDFRINEKEKLHFAYMYPEREFNPLFLYFGLRKRHDKLSIHFMSWISGYDLKTKEANFVEVGLDIKIFDYTNTFQEEDSYQTDFQTVLSDEVIQDWMEKINKVIKTFLN